MISDIGKPTKADQATLLRIGSGLTAAEAENLEHLLQTEPDNLSARFKLFGFYNGRIAKREIFEVDQVDSRLFEHLRWLLANLPGLPTNPDLVMPGYLACNLKQLRSLYGTLLDSLDSHQHSFALLLNYGTLPEIDFKTGEF